MAEYVCLLLCFLFFLLNIVGSDSVLCEQGFCTTYRRNPGCKPTSENCAINNSTHTGLTLPSPTLCNCCDYCLPFYGLGETCSRGGPGLGTMAGRCGDGLTCTTSIGGETTCTRMNTPCLAAQIDYDRLEANGRLGALQHRPHCDGKGKYAPAYCIPTQTCFCQSEDGERIFGEALNLGAITIENMHCGCSRMTERIKKLINPGVPQPVVGPRCMPDGSFSPIQCMGTTCYCVDTVTGVSRSEIESIDLEEKPISDLECYDKDLDPYPQAEDAKLPYEYTTPCLSGVQEKRDLILSSVDDGFNVDYFTSFPTCYPDGSYGYTSITKTGSKICIDDRNRQIEDYEAEPTSADFTTMNCKCARTRYVMGSSMEKPICCKNGNFRQIQCHRGMCRCVDSDGRQVIQEIADVTRLPCYTANWRHC